MSDAAAARLAAARSAGRRLSAVCLALLAGAAGLEGSGRLVWYAGGVEAVGRGVVPVTATGAALVPALTAVALLALAAVAAAVALAGVARRVLGAVVALAGAWMAVEVTRLLVAPPSAAALAALPGAPPGGTPVGAVALRIGPLPAALGALALVAAGVVLVVAEPRLARFGSRYSGGPAPEATDPDRAAWEALDAGRDPTTERHLDSDVSPDRGRTDGGAADRAV